MVNDPNDFNYVPFVGDVPPEELARITPPEQLAPVYGEPVPTPIPVEPPPMMPVISEPARVAPPVYRDETEIAGPTLAPPPAEFPAVPLEAPSPEKVAPPVYREPTLPFAPPPAVPPAPPARPTEPTLPEGYTRYTPADIGQFAEGGDAWQALNYGRTIILDPKGFMIDSWDPITGNLYSVYGEQIIGRRKGPWTAPAAPPAIRRREAVPESGDLNNAWIKLRHVQKDIYYLDRAMKEVHPMIDRMIKKAGEGFLQMIAGLSSFLADDVSAEEKVRGWQKMIFYKGKLARELGIWPTDKYEDPEFGKWYQRIFGQQRR